MLPATTLNPGTVYSYIGAQKHRAVPPAPYLYFVMWAVSGGCRATQRPSAAQAELYLFSHASLLTTAPHTARADRADSYSAYQVCTTRRAPATTARGRPSYLMAWCIRYVVLAYPCA